MATTRRRRPWSRSWAMRPRSLLTHRCETIPVERLTLPGPGWVDDVMTASRPARRRCCARCRRCSTRAPRRHRLHVDPARWTRASSTPPAASFAPNPDYFDPVKIIELAIAGECNAVATTLGALGPRARRRYAHRIPFLLKINHNEFLSYPNAYDQIMFASVKQAREMGCVAVGATIYFGSPESKRQIVEVSAAFAAAHELGMATVLWCYMRNSAFSPKDGGPDYHVAADLTSQANHLGVTIEADIIKQKLPETAAPGFLDLKFGKTDPRVYSELMTDHPIDMTRYQVANCYMGRIPLINSGGASSGRRATCADAVRTAVDQQARRRGRASSRAARRSSAPSPRASSC